MICMHPVKLFFFAYSSTTCMILIIVCISAVLYLQRYIMLPSRHFWHGHFGLSANRASLTAFTKHGRQCLGHVFGERGVPTSLAAWAHPLWNQVTPFPQQSIEGQANVGVPLRRGHFLELAPFLQGYLTPLLPLHLTQLLQVRLVAQQQDAGVTSTFKLSDATDGFRSLTEASPVAHAVDHHESVTPFYALLIQRNTLLREIKAIHVQINLNVRLNFYFKVSYVALSCHTRHFNLKIQRKTS